MLIMFTHLMSNYVRMSSALTTDTTPVRKAVISCFPVWRSSSTAAHFPEDSYPTCLTLYSNNPIKSSMFKHVHQEYKIQVCMLY
jgi:hypothetical protein